MLVQFGSGGYKDMVKRGVSMAIYKPPVSWADRVNNLMWSCSERRRRMVLKRNWTSSDGLTGEFTPSGHRIFMVRRQCDSDCGTNITNNNKKNHYHQKIWVTLMTL